MNESLTPAMIAALEAGRTPPPGYHSVMAWVRDYRAWLKTRGRGSFRHCSSYLGMTYSGIANWFGDVPLALPSNDRIAQLIEFKRLVDTTGQFPEPPIDRIEVEIMLAHRERLKELAAESGMGSTEWVQHAVVHAIEQGLVFGMRVVIEARKGRK